MYHGLTALKHFESLLSFYSKIALQLSSQKEISLIGPPYHISCQPTPARYTSDNIIIIDLSNKKKGTERLRLQTTKRLQECPTHCCLGLFPLLASLQVTHSQEGI